MDENYYEKTQNLFDPFYSDYEWCTLNIMLIEQKVGYAIRKAIGNLHETAWNHCNPNERMVYLE